MFRALWIKHWIQLRTLRWVGFGLCVAMPFFLWTGAAAAKRGWFPFSVGDYSLTTLFGEALPGFSALLWAFLAVMLAAQTFTGDRAEGTDRFLLERPVSRRKVWNVRVLATFASAMWVAVANTIYLFALVAIVNDGSVGGVFRGVAVSCGLGIAMVCLGTLGGMAAGEMSRTPMQAMMIGLILGALPVGITAFLSEKFRHAVIYDQVHVAWLLFPILPVVLVLASYRAGCLGEPSGRGRIQRGLAILALGVVLTPVLFAAAAPVAMRASVGTTFPQGIAAGEDRAILVGGNYSSRGGWIIDTAAAKRIRFLPPPLRDTSFNHDGTIAAVIHQSGALGSTGAPRLQFIDADGDTVSEIEIEADRNSYVMDIHWAGELLLLREWVGTRDARIKVVHPERGELGAIPVPEGKGRNWRLHGPTADGTVYLHRLVHPDPRRYELLPLDLEAFRMGPAILVEDEDLPTFARAALSPSGRYWARGVYSPTEQLYVSHVLDLEAGERADYPMSFVVGWLTGDRLVKVSIDKETASTKVIVEHADGEEILSRLFPPGVNAVISPDRTRFFVTQRAPEEGRYLMPTWWGIEATGLEQLLVCDGTSWSELESLRASLGDADHLNLNWGGPNMLLVTAERAAAVAEATPGAEWRAVIGSWN